MFGILVGAGLVVVGTAVFIHHRRGVRHAMLGHAFRRLRATEDQKQRLTSLLDDARGRLSVTRERLGSLRRELPDILAAPTIDTQRLETLEAQVFEALREGAQVVREVLIRTHEALNPVQRQQVADWTRRGHGSHHHRHWAACHC
jgi:Spy/CpxP family protein refolding chaperone